MGNDLETRAEVWFLVQGTYGAATEILGKIADKTKHMPASGPVRGRTDLHDYVFRLEDKKQAKPILHAFREMRGAVVRHGIAEPGKAAQEIEKALNKLFEQPSAPGPIGQLVARFRKPRAIRP